MQSELDKFDVSVIALSKDTLKETAIHKERDQLNFTLLSDPKLRVIRQYGVEHHKSLGFVTAKLKVAGVPLAFAPSFKAMAIPTSLLINEDGIIQWIDQSDDFRIRSNGDHVLSAVKSTFGAIR